jgi:uroporphyrinogen-III decarboxylase
MGTDGPLTVAANIRGATEFFTDLADDPEYARKLLEFITEATIRRIKAWRKYLGQPEKQENYWFADDSVQLISTEMYREFVLPCHKRLRAELSSTSVGGGVHLCGDSSRHFNVIRDELGMRSFDTGFPIDHAAIRKRLGPEIEILGGPPVEMIRSSTPEQVYERACEILKSGIMEGGRFVLREGNNLAPGTPLENIEALHRAAQTCGRYSN